MLVPPFIFDGVRMSHRPNLAEQSRTLTKWCQLKAIKDEKWGLSMYKTGELMPHQFGLEMKCTQLACSLGGGGGLCQSNKWHARE